MKKRILGLWVVRYNTGSTSERFLEPLNALDCAVDVFPLEHLLFAKHNGNIKALRYFYTELPKRVARGDYDMILHVPYPESIETNALGRLPILKVAWNGDDEWFWDKYPQFSRQINESHDFCVTTYEPAMERYNNPILASWGYSGDWSKKNVNKDIDVYFCGAKTPERDSYIAALTRAGVSVEVDGPGYSGKIPLKKMISKYRRAKIGLSFLLSKKENYYYQVKARSFEVPAVGTLQATEYCSDILRFFEEDEAILFRDTDDLVSKVKHFLKNKTKREKFALSGYEKNKQNSYKKIFKGIFDEIEKKSFSGVDA